MRSLSCPIITMCCAGSGRATLTCLYRCGSPQGEPHVVRVGVADPAQRTWARELPELPPDLRAP